MCAAPDSTCQNPLYELMKWTDDEGYADAGDAPIRVLCPEPAKPEAEPVDDEDAERVHMWVSQSGKSHREILVRRYVMWKPVADDELYRAIRAVLNAMADNRAVVLRMERR